MDKPTPKSQTFRPSPDVARKLAQFRSDMATRDGVPMSQHMILTIVVCAGLRALGYPMTDQGDL